MQHTKQNDDCHNDDDDDKQTLSDVNEFVLKKTSNLIIFKYSEILK